MAGLPRLEPLPARHMGGPTPYSNHVIPGRVIAGAFPASQDDTETALILTRLLELGVTTFVCLQAEVNVHVPEHAWRAGLGLRPYMRDAQRILTAAAAGGPGAPRLSQRSVDFLHLPIIDGSVTTDAAMSRLADECCERVRRGEQLYIHCWGGHGRTGTLVAVMLGRLYGLPYCSALRHTQAYHDARLHPQGVRSPQTPVQRAQVKRLLLASPGAVAAGAPLRPPAGAAAPAAAPQDGRCRAGGSGVAAAGMLCREAAAALPPPRPAKGFSRADSRSGSRTNSSSGDGAAQPGSRAQGALRAASASTASGLLTGVLQGGWMARGSSVQRGLVRSGSASRPGPSTSTSNVVSGGGGAAAGSGHAVPFGWRQPPVDAVSRGQNLQHSLRRSLTGGGRAAVSSGSLGNRSISSSLSSSCLAAGATSSAGSRAASFMPRPLNMPT